MSRAIRACYHARQLVAVEPDPKWKRFVLYRAAKGLGGILGREFRRQPCAKTLEGDRRSARLRADEVVGILQCMGTREWGDQGSCLQVALDENLDTHGDTQAPQCRFVGKC